MIVVFFLFVLFVSKVFDWLYLLYDGIVRIKFEGGVGRLWLFVLRVELV